MPANYYIAIDGVIGVGKTTLSRLIQNAFEAQLLLEAFEDNPFLSDFYADRAKYAFPMQIFFLLSRYQQQQVLGRLLREGPVVSDYTFAKDRLFAHLNLSGGELDTYERLHNILAENIVVPDLVVYLYADTPVLMERIAIRDRSYERGMSVEYIEALRVAYERFWRNYTDAPVLTINTNDLDVVRNPDDLALVIQRVRGALGEGTHQPALPEFASSAASIQGAALAASRRRLGDLQQWYREADMGLASDPYYHLMGLQEQVGGLAGLLAQVWTLQRGLAETYGNLEEALDAAVGRNRDLLERAMADCLTSIVRLANRLGIDLESAYLRAIRADEQPAQPDGQEQRP